MAKTKDGTKIGAHRKSSTKGTLDSYPTPPWGTRALFSMIDDLKGLDRVLEPCCGAGHMAKVLDDSFWRVEASDIYNYGYGAVKDFREPCLWDEQEVDYAVITNPPFNLANEFVQQMLNRPHVKFLAVLLRLSFIEGMNRYECIYKDNPPSYFFPFSERLSMVKNRLDEGMSGNVAYAWFVWDKALGVNFPRYTRTIVIPPLKKELIRAGDYDEPISSAPDEDEEFYTIKRATRSEIKAPLLF